MATLDVMQANRRKVRSRRGARKRPGEAGFTLVELLVVMAILALLASLVAPRVLAYLSSSRTKTAGLQIENLSTALELFKLDTGRYPKTQEGLAALVSRTGNHRNWNGPYLKGGKLPQDPWGHTYRYRYPGRQGEFDLYSFGADNRQGGTDEDSDVTNW